MLRQGIHGTVVPEQAIQLFATSLASAVVFCGATIAALKRGDTH